VKVAVDAAELHVIFRVKGAGSCGRGVAVGSLVGVAVGGTGVFVGGTAVGTAQEVKEIFETVNPYDGSGAVTAYTSGTNLKYIITEPVGVGPTKYAGSSAFRLKSA
jgi:hypothetical protein